MARAEIPAESVSKSTPPPSHHSGSGLSIFIPGEIIASPGPKKIISRAVTAGEKHPKTSETGGKVRGPTQIVEKFRSPGKDGILEDLIQYWGEEAIFLELMRFLDPTLPKARLGFDSEKLQLVSQMAFVEGRPLTRDDIVALEDLLQRTDGGFAGLTLEQQKILSDFVKVCFYCAIFGAIDAKPENFMRLATGRIIMHDGECLRAGASNKETLMASPCLGEPDSTWKPYHYLGVMRNNETCSPPSPGFPNIWAADSEIQKIKWKALLQIATVPFSVVRKCITWKNPILIAGYQQYVSLFADRGEGYWIARMMHYFEETFSHKEAAQMLHANIVITTHQREKKFIADIARAREYLLSISQAIQYLQSAECLADWDAWKVMHENYYFLGKDKMTDAIQEEMDEQFVILLWRSVEDEEDDCKRAVLTQLIEKKDSPLLKKFAKLLIQLRIGNELLAILKMCPSEARDETSTLFQTYLTILTCIAESGPHQVRLLCAFITKMQEITDPHALIDKLPAHLKPFVQGEISRLTSSAAGPRK